MEVHLRYDRKDYTTDTRRFGQKGMSTQKEQPTNSADNTCTDDHTDTNTDTLNLILNCNITTTPKNKKSRRFKKRTSVVNLSQHKLTRDEESILQKGLNFIPTPTRGHEAKIVQDFLLFERKLRLHHKVHNEEKEQSTDDSSEEEICPHKLLRPSKGYKPEDHEMDQNIMRYKTTCLNHLKN